MSAQALLALLADGELHSGERLAGELGISRAAVWKHVDALRSSGIDIRARRRAGYRLAAPVELLDARLIRRGLQAPQRARLARLDLLFEVDSTNTWLLEAERPAGGEAHAALTELQTGGRGRRGRRWLMPFGRAIALSLSWSFAESPRDLPALSLAVGVAVARALARVGARGVALKWPNDIWFAGRKAGGILIEMRAEGAGPAFVVIGIGLNVSLPERALEGLGPLGVPPAGVEEACAGTCSRNALAGALLDELLRALPAFEQDGFASFAAEWGELDALRGRPATVMLGGQQWSGMAEGIDADGGLLLRVGGERRKFVSGEASLRPQEGAA
ncbi:MAG: biotin--[acetyl-CoA-carboxylase] ligase [Steroidobacteraceae bacterium]